MIALDRPARLAIPRLGSPILTAGLYLYAGSAWGPGGIAARLGRHLRRTGRLHWHVDHLIAAGTIEATVAWPGARECEILARALAGAAASVPVPRFGASDCRTCPAHLLAVDRALVRALRNHDGACSTGGLVQ